VVPARHDHRPGRRDPEAAALLEAVFRDIVVVRGSGPMAVREQLPLTLPPQAAAQMAQQQAARTAARSVRRRRRPRQRAPPSRLTRCGLLAACAGPAPAAARPDRHRPVRPHPDQFSRSGSRTAGGPPGRRRPARRVLAGRPRHRAGAPLAADLAAAGRVGVAVEYRRVGGGGGWPPRSRTSPPRSTRCPDVSVADRLDLSAVTVIGHSAGGHLAAWAAGGARLPGGAPGCARRGSGSGRRCCRPASWTWSTRTAGPGARRRRGTSSAGRPASLPERLATADPVRCCPPGARVLCVHGAADDVVPPRQSERYADGGARGR
jgi:hypothetical protein